jgi:hypothetical protein
VLAGPPSAAKSDVARALRSRLESAGEVVEAAVPAWSLGNYRKAISGRPCHVVVLVPSLTGVEMPHVGLWIDIAHRTPEETVDEILARTS